MTDREAFEAFCSETGRHPDDMKMAICFVGSEKQSKAAYFEVSRRTLNASVSRRNALSIYPYTERK